MTITFTVADSSSGQVLHQLTERSTASEGGIKLGFGWSGTGGMDANAPISYAVQSCINKAAYRIAMELKDRPWRNSVVKVQNRDVWINAGSDRGMQVGMLLTALAKGEELIDPETGLSLGDQTEAVGIIQITTVQPAYSIATIVEGCDGLKAGDRVELTDSEGVMAARR